MTSEETVSAGSLTLNLVLNTKNTQPTVTASVRDLITKVALIDEKN
jgi:hypothetical protein